jgi:hypothetical protein
MLRTLVSAMILMQSAIALAADEIEIMIGTQTYSCQPKGSPAAACEQYKGYRKCESWMTVERLEPEKCYNEYDHSYPRKYGFLARDRQTRICRDYNGCEKLAGVFSEERIDKETYCMTDYTE